MSDASEIIQKQMLSNPGLFVGTPRDFSDFAVKSAESRWKGLFEVLKRYDFLPSAQVWAACGVASILPSESNKSGLFTSTKFTAGHDFSLILLCKLLDDIEIDYNLKTTIPAIESDLLSEAVKVRDNAFHELNQK